MAVAAVALAVAASSTAVHAQEYPWCLSREGYLYCIYKTEQQCKWTASGMSGCEKNPRLLFPEKPRDSNRSPQTPTNTRRNPGAVLLDIADELPLLI